MTDRAPLVERHHAGRVVVGDRLLDRLALDLEVAIEELLDLLRQRLGAVSVPLLIGPRHFSSVSTPRMRSAQPMCTIGRIQESTFACSGLYVAPCAGTEN